jgi:hypothetical protein
MIFNNKVLNNKFRLRAQVIRCSQLNFFICPSRTFACDSESAGLQVTAPVAAARWAAGPGALTRGDQFGDYLSKLFRRTSITVTI